MPKFSESEKSIIQERLKEAGRNLFAQHGLKKVTIDDLVNSTNIAKGSFYAFYENKEQLFMELNTEEQKKIFDEIDREMQSSGIKEPKSLTSFVFKSAIELFINNPIVTQINDEIINYLQRKIPNEMLEQHIANNSHALKKLELYGVEFNYPTSIVEKTLQPVFVYAISSNSDCDYNDVLNILIDGVISQIVK